MLSKVKKAFFALVANGLRAALLWDNKLKSFVGKKGDYNCHIKASVWCQNVVNPFPTQGC